MARPERWTTAVLDVVADGGWAVVQSEQGFLVDANAAMFPRGWLAGLDLPVQTEHGIGYFEADPVYLLVLDRSVTVE
ncbi:NUDIX-like domain-containing protein, partial [Pseudomonas syringae group genomosp. 7]|uniref:NUDIX-like domain-containing protein n=1 Tax=Pseudomonas syringae group genomosp. 7 TaxID=251699 RepID=UPI00376FD964